jgi:hypothetical protein
VAVVALVIAAGWLASVITGGLLAAFLDLLFVIDVKVNPRTQARITAHSVLLSEWLREDTQDETGR